MTLRRRLHPGVSRTATPTILVVLVMTQLVTTSCDAFIASRLLGASLSSPPLCWRGRRGSRREAPKSFWIGRRGHGLCSSSNNGSRRRPAKRNNGDDAAARSRSSSRTNGDDDGDAAAALSITTFNVLAPIFKRVGTGRESEFREAYLERHAAIIEHLKV